MAKTPHDATVPAAFGPRGEGMRRLLVLSMLLAAVGTSAAAAPPQRCGWIANPTPANWWLNDRDGEWIISVQGGYQAPGVDLPDFTVHDWVVTNAGDHGYGCACLTGLFDKKTMQVTRIDRVRQRTLKQCKADKALKRP